MKMKVIRVESRKNGSSAGGSLGYRKDPERKKKTINMQKENLICTSSYLKTSHFSSKSKYSSVYTFFP